MGDFLICEVTATQNPDLRSRPSIVHRTAPTSILILRYRKASIYSSIKARTKSSLQPQLCCIQPGTAHPIPSQPRTSCLIFRSYGAWSTTHACIFQVSISRLEDENFTASLSDGRWRRGRCARRKLSFDREEPFSLFLSRSPAHCKRRVVSRARSFRITSRKKSAEDTFTTLLSGFSRLSSIVRSFARTTALSNARTCLCRS